MPWATNRKDMNGGYRTELQQQDLNKQKTLRQICFVRQLCGLPLAEPGDNEWNHPLKRAHWLKNRKFRTIKSLSPRDPTSSTKVASSDPDNYKEPRTELKLTQTQRQKYSGRTVGRGQKISWHSGGRAPIRKDKCVCPHFPEPRTLKTTHRKCDPTANQRAGI